MCNANNAVAGARASPNVRRAYVYRHVVSFEETNLVGNVYFAKHIAWQGRCRELFLKECAPEIVDELCRELRLVTLKASCEYFEEIRAFDTIEVLMHLVHIRQNRIALDFEYRRVAAVKSTVVALGCQELSCMKVADGVLKPCPLPTSLADALRAYQKAA